MQSRRSSRRPRREGNAFPPPPPPPPPLTADNSHHATFGPDAAAGTPLMAPSRRTRDSLASDEEEASSRGGSRSRSLDTIAREVQEAREREELRHFEENTFNGIYVDPKRDVDIAPLLHCCCGCLPCCCCLYANLDDDDQDEEDEYYSFDEDVSVPSVPSAPPPRPPRGDQPPKRKHNPFPVNRNVLLMLITSFVYGIADSLWSGTVLSAYLLEVDAGRNDYVGYLEAVHGLSALLTSFPLGYAADKWSRSGVLKVGGLLFVAVAALNTWLLVWVGTDEGGLGGGGGGGGGAGAASMSLEDAGDLSDGLWACLAAAVPKGVRHWGTAETNAPPLMGFLKREDATTSLASVLSSTVNSSKIARTFHYFIPLMALWGVTSSVINGPGQVLFAESIPAGSRSQYFVLVFISYMLASTLGPLLGIILFQGLGDEWNVSDLRIVLFVGMGMEVVVGIMCLFFWDGYALEEAKSVSSRGTSAEEGSQGLGSAATPRSATTPRSAVTPASAATPQSQEIHQEEGSVLSDPLLESPSVTASAATQDRTKRDCSPAIPYILFLSSLIISAGGGMTVKFFPLYFKNDVDLSPTWVQTVYALVPLAMVITSDLSTRISAKFGRVHTILLTKGLGVLGLFLLSYGEKLFRNSEFALVPIFILRTALMNSSHPLEESIMMDFVERKKRGRWKSLEGLSVAAWAGSAALGGFLVDQHDYTYTFSITAIIQAVGVVGFLFLLPLVPRHEKDLAPPAKSPRRRSSRRGSRHSSVHTEHDNESA